MKEFNDCIVIDEYYMNWGLFITLDGLLNDTEEMYNQDPLTEELDGIIYE